MTIIVETHDLTRRYGGTIALDSLNLQIPQGAVYGFIGPNGAGKTTTIDPGHAAAADLGRGPGVRPRGRLPVADDPPLIGYVPDFFGAYDDMVVAGVPGVLRRRVRHPVGRARPKLIGDVLELTDLSYKRDALVDSLSRGMKQRLSLARVLLHDPQVLLLDEPASGLDPRARIEIRELLKELHRMGKTIVISSHILTELAEMCIDGRDHRARELLASGDVETIMHSLQPHRTFSVHLLSDVAQAAELARGAPHVLDVRLPPEGGPPQIEIDVDGDDRAVSELLARLILGGAVVTHFAGQVSDLEDIFMRITEGSAYGGTN